jgi:hypothetical protein
VLLHQNLMTVETVVHLVVLVLLQHVAPSLPLLDLLNAVVDFLQEVSALLSERVDQVLFQVLF